MSTEQKIMCAIVQVDMFLVGCWKWMLVILFIMGISIVVMHDIVIALFAVQAQTTDVLASFPTTAAED